MNDSPVPAPPFPTPPFSEDLLADLHGGVLDPDTSDALWPLAEAQPDAQAFLRLLDSVTLSLRTLSDTETTYEPMPPKLAARLQAALDEEWNQQHAQKDSASRTLPFRRPRREWMMSAVAAAAVAVVAVLMMVRPTESSTDLTAHPTPTASDIVNPEGFLSLIGSKNLGPLDDPKILAGCLLANGFAGDQALLGSGEVTLDGIPAVVLLLRGTLPRQITALAVGPNCSAGNPNLLSISNIG